MFARTARAGGTAYTFLTQQSDFYILLNLRTIGALSQESENWNATGETNVTFNPRERCSQERIIGILRYTKQFILRFVIESTK